MRVRGEKDREEEQRRVERRRESEREKERFKEREFEGERIESVREERERGSRSTTRVSKTAGREGRGGGFEVDIGKGLYADVNMNISM
eukprot:1358461-Amorphochlora_amoeboformis.AAC.1